MLETLGRKLFRTPFPQSRPTSLPDPYPDKEQVQHLQEGDSVIADADTREMLSLALSSSRNSAITDADTREMPSETLHSSCISAIADAETFKMFSFPFFSSNTLSPSLVQKKTKHTQVSQRKKILLLVLIIALLVPTFITLFEIINAVLLYSQLQDGITHLQNVVTLFHGSSNGVGGVEHYLDRGKLLQAQEEIDAAHADFASLRV